MGNNLQKIFEEREAMLPPELETRISQHLGAFSVFGNVVELFMPNALQTVVRLIGGEELPCLHGKRQARHEPEWRTPPKPGGPIYPDTK